VQQTNGLPNADWGEWRVSFQVSRLAVSDVNLFENSIDRPPPEAAFGFPFHVEVALSRDPILSYEISVEVPRRCIWRENVYLLCGSGKYLLDCRVNAGKTVLVAD